mmetsp:Transcript_52238/g.77927  ORF Transcript_52238/g.77927 Transcript_52238/m.77927 type:complete len:203 (-) Transcript_52238:265-873(-)
MLSFMFCSLTLLGYRSPGAVAFVQTNVGRRRGTLARLMSSSDVSEKKQHLVRWKSPGEERDVIFEVEDGELLRTAALRRGLVTPHNGRSRLINCRGLGTCGTCAVEIKASDEADESLLGPPLDPPNKNNREELRLNFPPHDSSKQSPFLRLSCQCAVKGDIVVTKRAGFWGQDDEMVRAEEYKTYFGDFEFLLDNRSPPDQS